MALQAGAAKSKLINIRSENISHIASADLRKLGQTDAFRGSKSSGEFVGLEFISANFVYVSESSQIAQYASH